MRTVLAPNAPWPTSSEPVLGVQQQVARFIQHNPGSSMPDMRSGTGLSTTQVNHALAKLRTKLRMESGTVKTRGNGRYPWIYFWIGDLQ